jgi:SAM-dependent methyltransferase
MKACIKCGAEWHGETGREPCSAGGQCVLNDGRWLHFGPGKNLLPPPWENLTPADDIRKPLRFETESVDRILLEHVIEHVSHAAALHFLQEAHRVLQPGGVLRIGFPDVSRFVVNDHGNWWRLTDSARCYAASLAQYDAEFWSKEKAILMLIGGWGHQAAWTQETLAAALLASGFREVGSCTYNMGQIHGCDGHHLDVGTVVADLETSIVEATK